MKISQILIEKLPELSDSVQHGVGSAINGLANQSTPELIYFLTTTVYETNPPGGGILPF